MRCNDALTFECIKHRGRVNVHSNGKVKRKYWSITVFFGEEYKQKNILSDNSGIPVSDPIFHYKKGEVKNSKLGNGNKCTCKFKYA